MEQFTKGHVRKRAPLDFWYRGVSSSSKADSQVCRAIADTALARLGDLERFITREVWRWLSNEHKG